jgi:hypothetical protein
MLYALATMLLSGFTAGGGSSPLTTKGDVYTYSTADARLAAGANGLCLQTDSAEATGLKWASCGGGATFNAGTFTVSFGSGNLSIYDSAEATVSAAWVASGSAISLTPKCVATVGGNTIDNCLVLKLACSVSSISAGVSFGVICHAPFTASGDYTISYVGG